MSVLISEKQIECKRSNQCNEKMHNPHLPNISVQSTSVIPSATRASDILKINSGHIRSSIVRLYFSGIHYLVWPGSSVAPYATRFIQLTKLLHKDQRSFQNFIIFRLTDTLAEKHIVLVKLLTVPEQSGRHHGSIT